MKTIIATYNGYEGIAYGKRSFSVKNSEGREIFHTGSCTKRPQNKDDVIESIKTVLSILNTLDNVVIEDDEETDI